jgi:hypothetical protein
VIRFARILLFSFVLSLFFAGRPARAVTFGDAALTVSVATVSGAVLGASTLPFYEDSGAHTKNIFYGAAIGAVIGVFVAAYSGVQEGQDQEMVLRRAPADARFAFSREIKPETTTAKLGQASMNPLVWSPIARVRF